VSVLLNVTAPIFLVLGFGYLAVWKGFFSDEGADMLMKFTTNFAFPCLLFRAISTLNLAQHFDWPLLVSYYTGSVTVFGLGIAGAMLLFRRPLQDAIAIGFACMFANSVMLGLVVTQRAFGADALGPNYGIVAIHAPFCYLLGVTAMEVARNPGGGALVAARSVATSMARNALMIGILLGFAANLSGLTVPGVVSDAIDLMVRAALPVALFSLGGVLVRYRPEGDLVQAGFVAAVSLVVHPLIVWLMATKVIGIDRASMQSAILTAAMAPGVNSYIFANMYGTARRVAATSLLIATGASIVTVSGWLMVIG